MLPAPCTTHPRSQDEVLSVFAQVALSPSEVCGILLGSSCGDPYNPWNQTWTVKLPPTPKPPVVPVPPPKVYSYVHAYLQHLCMRYKCIHCGRQACVVRASVLPTSSQPGSPVSKVLYLSDIHFDKNYTVGLNAECGEPLCCRPPNGPPRESICLYTHSNSCQVRPYSLSSLTGVVTAAGKRAAGPWGDYNCDCPLQTLENLLQHVGNMSKEVCQGTHCTAVCAVWLTLDCLVFGYSLTGCTSQGTYLHTMYGTKLMRIR